MIELKLGLVEQLQCEVDLEHQLHHEDFGGVQQFSGGPFRTNKRQHRVRRALNPHFLVLYAILTTSQYCNLSSVLRLLATPHRGSKNKANL
jgi:hypothetical protein